MNLNNLKYARIIIFMLIAFVVNLFSVRNVYAQQGGEKKLPNIIIVVLSGVSGSESIDDRSHQYMPNLWGKIIKEGTLYSNLTDYNLEFHLPTSCAILTGKFYNDYSGGYLVPNIFQYIRKKYELPSQKLWIFGTWVAGETRCLNTEFPESTAPSYITTSFEMSPESKKILTKKEAFFVQEALGVDTIRQSRDLWDSVCTLVYDLSKKVVRAYKPNFILYIMHNVESAHYDTFGRYVLALKKSDESINDIWEMIQNDPYYKDNTYLFVTPDSQRNPYYMQHFLSGRINQVWLYAYGPKIKKGVTIKRPIRHMDIFATIADITGVKTHPTEGRPLKDSFNPNG